MAYNLGGELYTTSLPCGERVLVA